MNNFKKYSKIRQFRDIIYDLKKQMPVPVVTFTGLVKLHGTNVGIGFNYETQEIFIQKRNSSIDENENFMGFDAWFYSDGVKDAWIKYFKSKEPFWNGLSTLIYYGEWAGQGVLGGTGISKLPKSFYVFEAKLYHHEHETNSDGSCAYIPYAFTGRNFPLSHNIGNIPGAKFEMEIDFSKPTESQNKLIEITENIEKECPVAKHFGEIGTGEGVVWSAYYNNKMYRFKVKGEKHSVSKVKTLAPVDIEKIKSINEFIENVVTENRLEQGIQYLKDENMPIKIESLGNFIKWVFNDIIDEEALTIEASGFTKRDYSSNIANVARLWYMNKLNFMVGI